ncbi:Glucose-1-phosphate adenylyltransferase [Heracleum sosnowskyi]|uniref:Glucose-1-phosphate adenylyltransferase n=1 Tax=Heracleum sosnowskyi TaxID=360622 RepID=A0AAD8J832_9APIA|nr:Glucose-1-phosphate adenylyltransferase [Heracleum sosnowskyi]
MDSWCVSMKSSTHFSRVRSGFVSNGDQGFWGERIKGGVKSTDLSNFFAKSSKIGTRVRMIKPGAVFSVLTSRNDKETLTMEDLQVPQIERKSASSNNVAAIILGGGAGTKLFPLTRRSAIPAVPVGGCYRLIDIPMSNCINSRINKILVLTQFNSASLNRHLARTYFGNGVNFGDGFVEVLAATQTPGEAGMNWFQGTADAVRQFMWVFEDAKNKAIENILILSGDQLYRMDYMDLVQNHMDRNADITVSCVPVGGSRVSEYGLMKINKRGQVIEFAEKPSGANLKSMQVDTTFLGVSPEDATKSQYIASMGVYVFKKDVLLNLLQCRYPKSNDFGSEIIPSAVMDHNVQAYLFRDYWEDIGTIKSFYDANLALTDEIPKFEFYDPETPFFTSPRFLPPTKFERSIIKDAIISHGCFLQECSVVHSIVGERSRLDSGVELKDTLMMGADYYQTESEIASLLAEGKVPIGIGQNSKISNCIIDKNAKIGKDVIIMNKNGVQEADRPDDGFYIRSGITIIMEKATISNGTVI